VRAGQLDRKIEIQRYAPNRDETSGEIVPGWATLYTVWASKKQQSGREAIRAEQLVASQTVVFTIRYKDVQPKDRVLFEGRYYDIKSINELGRKEGLELITEGKDNG
jgi:SPP1 family predicted phage head-tail adaptor